MNTYVLAACGLIGAAVVSTHCGSAETGTDTPDCGDGPCLSYRPLEGLGPGGLARPIGDEFSTTGRRLVASPDGASWLLWLSHANPDDHAGTVRIDRFDPDGVWVGTSTLTTFHPEDLVLHPNGRLVGWKNTCGPARNSVCWAVQTQAGGWSESFWAATPRTLTTHLIDDNGDPIGKTKTDTFERRVVTRAVASSDGLYAVTNEGANFVTRLSADLSPRWTRRLFPRVFVDGIGPDSPIDELTRAIALTRIAVTAPVRVGDGVVVAAAVGRATVAALNLEQNLDLPLSEDPTCADIVVAHVSDDGDDVRYTLVPTDLCEWLPKLAVVNGHAIVASIVGVPKAPTANDSEQYDLGVSVVDLGSSATRSVLYGGDEDEWVEAITPCGNGRACIAGVFGSRSVDTGSVVTFGDGFIVDVSIDGDFGTPWTMTSPRHSRVFDVAPTDRGDVLFFGTTNGPITHTGDSDARLNFNEGRLGVVSL